MFDWEDKEGLCGSYLGTAPIVECCKLTDRILIAGEKSQIQELSTSRLRERWKGYLSDS